MIRCGNSYSLTWLTLHFLFSPWGEQKMQRLSRTLVRTREGPHFAAPSWQSASMGAYWHFVIMFTGGVETLWLGSLYSRNLIKWEPIWCTCVLR
jgi:hypothetical protein